ncbi:MAG: iron-containing alcohol dehydrogenase [Anaeroplasmataceae bacterium]
MDNFTYYTPTKIFFGAHEEENIGKIIKSYGFKKVLVHYGMGSIKKQGLYDLVLNKLKENDIDYVTLGGVMPNPINAKVLEGIRLCKEEKVDFILAVGGGSVIDSAKSIADGALIDYNPWLFHIKEKIVTKALPVGVILTISAAGSCMSESCVITNELTKEKRGFNSEFHRPLFAVLNPVLTYTVDKYQTACGIVDIMMHTMERYYSINDNTPLTDAFDIALCKEVYNASKTVLNNPCDYNSRATLMWASSLSHNGLTGCGKKYFMPVHQIEHEISGMFSNVAHGAGLAVIFIAWAKVVYKSDINRFRRFAIEVLDVNPTSNYEKDALNGIYALEAFYKEIGMPVRLSELGITRDSFEELAYNFTFKGMRTIPDRVLIDYDKCYEILKLAE